MLILPQDHHVSYCAIMNGMASSIARHKTAIRRHDLSLPVKCLLRDGLISTESSVFDYGCGHGENIELLNSQNINSRGWDPAFRPDEPQVPSDVVNLGYVINVIEDAEERSQALRTAWDLAHQVLAVSAQVQVNGRGNKHVQFGDGIVTRLGTFQKYFTQSELKDYIESELDAEAIPAALGIYYVFKDEQLQQQYLASRYRRRAAAPRMRISELRFEEHKDLLEQLMAAIADFGRLPESDEFERAQEVIGVFGSLKRAFALIKRVTGTEEWETIHQRRTEDVLVYLALSRFRKRPALRKLPRRLQVDIRTFFGSYKKACDQADGLLFQAGDPDTIDEACKRSPIGKLLPNALYVHESALDSLEPMLRIYEGCARAYLGEIEDTNIVKLHRFSGKMSYLAYPDFEKDPHPALLRSVKLNLRSRELNCFDYANSDNPPILHRKEAFLEPDHPSFKKFARLTKQEEDCGLLTDSATIGTRDGWECRLASEGFMLRGHRLMRLRS